MTPPYILPISLLQKIDNKRGDIPRSTFIRRATEPLSVRERALKVFSNIEGLDDIKEMMLRALDSPERAHTLNSISSPRLFSIAIVYP
jgi:hypothetical protein